MPIFSFPLFTLKSVMDGDNYLQFLKNKKFLNLSRKSRFWRLIIFYSKEFIFTGTSLSIYALVTKGNKVKASYNWSVNW